ncbi:hypothetical protein QFZ80_004255 [Paenibacillus sp. V4I7]|nr:hypothetical protein [Paenibacillus sp. V4I7]
MITWQKEGQSQGHCKMMEDAHLSSIISMMGYLAAISTLCFQMILSPIRITTFNW